MNKSPLLKYVSLKAYLTGFIASIILTLLAFGFTTLHVNSGHIFMSHDLIIPVILVLALVQLAVQSIFFLHLLNEDNPRWNLMFFLSTFGLLVIIVIASILIINNLNYNMMPMEQTQYIIVDEGIKIDK